MWAWSVGDAANRKRISAVSWSAQKVPSRSSHSISSVSGCTWPPSRAACTLVARADSASRWMAEWLVLVLPLRANCWAATPS
ncbi:hypothetical protein D9M68_771910 [compost metagenome]